MKRTLGIALLAATALSTAAIAAPERIRGTVSAVSADSVTVHGSDNKDTTVALTPDTKYNKVLKSSLSKIDKDSYIGTATKEVGGKLIALEVVVFPASMKGSGEGHYAWDRIADTTLAGSHGSTSSAMTNGTVATVKTTGGTANSTMTNGTVAASNAKGGAKQLTVSYKGGEQMILVPPTAPIVTFQPSDHADLTTGKMVIVFTGKDATPTARAVAIGTAGAPPPM